MSTLQAITQEYFTRRLVELCVKSRLQEFPKNELDLHILLKSAMMTLGDTTSFTEREITDKLTYWVNEIGRIAHVDRVTLRRQLVDSGYLTRSSDGGSYHVAQPGPQPGLFPASIDQLDVMEIILNGREEIERRKREYMEKSKGK